MKTLRALVGPVLAAFSATVPVALQAASSALDTDFVSTISPGLTPTSYPTFDSGTGAVNATALQSDGKILAGGNISRYKTSGDLTALKRLLPTGALDTSFNSGGAGLAASEGQPEVNALLVDSTDRIYVGGTFSSYNGAARSGVLRLHADGTLDDDYAPAGLGGANRYAQTLALQPDGKLLVGGGFTSINGNGRSHLARLNADGTLDSTFTAFAAFSSTFTAAVRDIALLPDGRILVGGVSSTSRPVFIRLLANGALDPTFAPGLVNSTGSVNELLLLPDGRALAAGFFTLSDTGQEVDLAAFHADGALDTAFLANLGAGPNGSVLDLALQPDGTVLASGVFNLWNGQPRASIARLDLSGELLADPAPLPYTDNRDNPDVTPFYLTHIYSLSVQPDGKLVAGGWFSRVTDPALETFNLTRLVNEYSASSPGALRLLSAKAVTAENAGSLTLQVSRFGGLTGAVSVQVATATGGANGTATAGSDFTATSSTLSWAAGEGGFKTVTVPILQDTVAESAETFTVTLSSPTGGATIPATHAKTVVTLRDDDSAPTITRQPVGVSIEQGAGFTLSVRYDSVLPATVQWQRDPDGLGVGAGFADIPGATGLDHVITVSDPSLHNGHYRAVVSSSAGSTNSAAAELFVAVPAGSVIPDFIPPSISESIVASALDHQSRHLVGSQLGLRRYTVFGELDTTFAAATFASLPVSSVYPLLDGRVLVGGFFTTVNGTARATLARFSSAGVLDTTFAPALPAPAGSGSATLYAQSIAPGTGGKYYVGFGAGGGLRRYHADGSHDTGFTATTVGTNLGGVVYAVRERPDGRVLVAHISGANGFGFTYNLSLLEANGTAASASLFTSPALNNSPRAIELLPDGRIALGGQFNTVNGTGAARLALLHPNGTVDGTFFAPTGIGPDGAVHRVIYREGRLLVAGEFFNIGGQALRGVARVNLDGSLDSTFSAGAGANGSVFTAHLTGQNDLFIAGNFTTFKGVARNRAALLTLNPLIGAIGFAPPRVEITDAGGTALLTLRRYGPATEAASIRYATADSAPGFTTATAGADYTAASGTVSWAAGDSADKTIAIPVLEDSVIEPAETFRVVLSEPTGPVTPAASATITLLDSDTLPSFTTQPSATQTNLTVGGAIVLNVTVASPTPATYQWFHNGVALPGITGLGYVKTPVTLADAGLYTLVVTNAAGSVTSQAVHIVVSPQGGRPFPGQPTTGRPQFDSFSGPSSLLALPDGGALIGGLFTLNASLNRPQSYILRIRADGTTDTSFSLALNAPVVALRAQPDGKILVLGNFTTVNSVAQRYLVRLNADLSLDSAFNTAAATALTTTTVPGSASAINLALDSTGRIYVGYSYLGGFIRRISGAGVLDAAYLVGTTNGGPFGLAVDSSDRLLVGGGFSNIGVVTAAGNAPSTSPARASLARLAADGSVDQTFVPALGGSSVRDISIAAGTGRIFAGLDFAPGLVEVDPAGTGTVFNLGNNNSVTETALSPDGRPTLTRSVNGATAVQRFIPAATLGGSATADTAYSTGTGPNGNVTTLAYRPDGALWIAGDFTTVNGVATASVALLQPGASDPGIVNPPARADVNAGGTATFAVGAVGTNLAYQWFKNGAPLANDARISGATAAVLRITGLLASDDDTYTVQVTGGAPSTTVESGPAKLNVLGAPVVVSSPASIAPAFGSTATLAAEVLAATPATYVWKRGGVTIVNGGRYSGATTATLVVTGANNTDNGAYTLTVTNSLGAASTTPATITVSQVATDRDPSTLSLSATSRAFTILHLPDGRSLVGSTGQVFGASGTSTSTRLSIVETDGRVTATAAGNFNSNVSRLVALPGGKFLVLGGFTSVGGVTATGRSRMVRLNADLGFDSTFTPYTSASDLTTAVVDTQGRIYLAGGFVGYNGVSGYNYLVRLSADGVLDPTFNLNLATAPNDLLVQPDGKILVGGGFTSYGAAGASTAVKGLLRLNADGSVDTGFASEAAPSDSPINSVISLALDSQNRVLVGLQYYTPAYAPMNTVVRLLPSGAKDSAFTFTEAVSQFPYVLRVVAGDKVLVGGNFTTPAVGLFRLNSDGSRDTAFTTELGSGFGTSGADLRAIVPDSLGRLWIAGGFSKFKDVTVAGLVVLQGESPALGFIAQPAPKIADLAGTATFTAAGTGNNGFAYQWLKNGVPLTNSDRISGATTPTLTIAGLVATDAAGYSVRITSPGGTATSQAALLVVLAAPEIMVPPAAVTRDLGSSATFSASARGAGALTYEWLFNNAPLTDGTVAGVTISGAATSSLTISGLTFAEAGEYRLRVTNSLGQAVSPGARLSVERRPGVLAAGFPQPSFNSDVYAILRLSDGSMLVGGGFTTVTINGVASNRSRLARFLADGTLDPAFTPTITGSVRALAQDSAGRVFIGGDFTGSITIGGVSATRTRVARLTSALVLDTAFDSATGPSGGSNSVLALAPSGDGGVYVGGRFTQVGAVTTGVNRMAKLNASGALDAAGFTSYAANDVNTILRLANGTLYVGGSSNTWNTPALPGSPAGRLVKLNANGSTRDTGFASPDIFTIVNRVIRLADGTLLVAGNTFGQPYLKRLNASTGADATDPAYVAAGHTSQVNAIAQQADGKLLSGALGTFKRTDLSGTADDGFGAFNTTISAIELDDSGRIWVGGSFTTYNGATANRLAVLAGGEYDIRDGLLLSQTLTFTDIADRPFGATVAANTVPLAATSDRGLSPITFVVTSGPATISGDNLVVTGAGTVVVEARQAGNAIYRAATASQTITVNKAAQTIAFADPADRAITAPAFELSATATSGLPVTFTVSGVATLGADGKTVTLTGVAGTVTVTATQAGDANYNAAPPVPQSFEVTAGVAQTITFNTLPSRVAGAKFTVAATASSGLPVTFAVASGSATLAADGKTVTVGSTAGTVTIRATQAGGERAGVIYAAAAPVDQSFEVTLGPPTTAQTITFTAPAKATYGDAPLVLSATANSGLPVGFTVVSGPATLDGSALTFTGAGRVVVRATQTGSYPYKPAAAVTRTITVGKAVLLVHAEDAVRLVGETNPVLPLTLSGFIGSDTVARVSKMPVATVKAAKTSSAGLYPIGFTGGVSADYTFARGDLGDLVVIGYAGTYEALLVDEDSIPVGKLSLLVSKNSLGYTGTLNLARETKIVSVSSTSKSAGTGALVATEDFASASATWTRTTAKLDALSLAITVSADGSLAGSLTRNGEAFATLSGGRILYAPPRQTVIPWAGQHTLALHSAFDPSDSSLPAPGSSLSFPRGSGVATAAVSPVNGQLVIRGKLADGTTLTSTLKPWVTTTAGALDQVGYVAWITPYANRAESFLAGPLNLQPHPETDRFGVGRRHIPSDAGLLHWKKAGNAKDKSYRDGFGPLSVSVSLDPWLPPVAAKPARGATPAVEAVSLPQRLGLAANNTATAGITISHGPDELDLGELGGELPFAATFAATPAPTVKTALAVSAPSANPTKWKLTSFNAATGAFAGAFILSDQVKAPPAKPTPRTVAFTGTLRQAPADEEGLLVGTGFFLVPALPGADSTEQPSGELRFTAPAE